MSATAARRCGGLGLGSGGESCAAEILGDRGIIPTINKNCPTVSFLKYVVAIHPHCSKPIKVCRISPVGGKYRILVYLGVVKNMEVICIVLL